MKKTLLVVLIFIVIVLSVVGGVYYAQKEFLAYLYHEIIEKGKALALTRPSQEIHFSSGDLGLSGSLYLPDNQNPAPGLVFTHGGTSVGRKLPLYQVLCKRLAQQGYAVLSFDFRGYGESDKPKEFDSPDDLDFLEDVKQAVSFLTSVDSVDPEQLFLVGHSFGAGVIIPAGVLDNRIKGIISIAPGRRGYELFWAPNAPYPFSPRRRLARDMELSEIQDMSLDLVNPLLQYVTIDTILDFPVHPPLLLIDGALEGQQDLDFLRKLYEDITEPKAYVTIPEAKHYFGVRRDDAMAGTLYLVPYWKHIMDELVESIDAWLRKNSQ